MISMYKIGIMGDHDTVMLFQTVGIETFPVVDENDARRTFMQLAKGNYGVIFITEPVAIQMMDLIDEYEEAITPSVILIPTSQGSLGIGKKRINQSVEKAIGINILQSGEADKN